MMPHPPMCQLLKIEITRDINNRGERAWLVTPVYRRHGHLISIPDDRGWPTKAEALEDQSDRLAAMYAYGWR